MYNFAFYFFYRELARRNDDSIFTSILGVFIIIGLHFFTIIKVLDNFGIISYPTFSSTYLYNKLYWYIPCAVILGVVYLYFNKVKTKAIIEKYSANDNFYSIGNILLFLLQILIPILIIVKIK